MQVEEVQAHLGPALGAGLLEVTAFPRLAARVRFDRKVAIDLFRAVRDGLGFHHLSMVGGIDWVDHREVFYVVWSDAAKQYLLMTTDVPADDPRVESAVPVWPSANWHEREAFELVGLTFDHHPDLRRLLTPEGYEFFPLLRSFKLHEPEELEVKRRNV